MFASEPEQIDKSRGSPIGQACRRRRDGTRGQFPGTCISQQFREASCVLADVESRIEDQQNAACHGICGNGLDAVFVAEACLNQRA